MISTKYLFEALFFLGVAVAIIKWIGRTMGEISEASPRNREPTDVRLERLFRESGAAAYIAAQNDGPPANTDRIAAHERAAHVKEDALIAAAHAPIASGTVPPLPNAGRMTGIAVRLYCPVCAEPMTEVPTPLPFALECQGCHRRINARGDGPGRISVVAIEPKRAI